MGSVVSLVVVVGVELVAAPMELFNNVPLPPCAHPGVQLVRTRTTHCGFNFAELYNKFPDCEGLEKFRSRFARVLSSWSTHECFTRRVRPFRAVATALLRV